MLYVFHGSDTDTSREKARALLDSLREKKPDASFFRLDAESWSAASFDEWLSSSGLFERRVVVFLDRVFENAEAKDFLLKNIEPAASSENIVILLENELDAAAKKILAKYAEKVQEHEIKEKTKAPEASVFALSDAVARRDKKAAWVLYQQHVRAGAAPEELHGVLWWQFKTMLQVAAGATEGLKPFVVSKARGFLKNYSSAELDAAAFGLITLYHQSRRGITDFDTALEKFILEM